MPVAIVTGFDEGTQMAEGGVRPRLASPLEATLLLTGTKRKDMMQQTFSRIAGYKKSMLAAASLLTAIAGAHLQAAVPLVTSYQGRVSVAGTSFTGNGQFKFALIAKPGGASLWSNDGTSVAGSEPTAAVPLSVSDGLFSVLLGDATLPNMQALPPNLFAANSDVCLRVWFDDGVNGSSQLAPDTRLASARYALAADVPAGSIAAEHLADATINPGKLAVVNQPVSGMGLGTTIPRGNLHIHNPAPPPPSSSARAAGPKDRLSSNCRRILAWAVKDRRSSSTTRLSPNIGWSSTAVATSASVRQPPTRGSKWSGRTPSGPSVSSR
jgi:hypothetical protein